MVWPQMSVYGKHQTINSDNNGRLTADQGFYRKTFNSMGIRILSFCGPKPVVRNSQLIDKSFFIPKISPLEIHGSTQVSQYYVSNINSQRLRLQTHGTIYVYQLCGFVFVSYVFKLVLQSTNNCVVICVKLQIIILYK